MSGRRGTIVRWLIGLALVGVLVSWLDLGAIRDRLAAADLRLAIPALLGLVGVHCLAALSWRRLTAAIAGVHLGWRGTVGLYYAAQAFGTVTPANIGADVYRVMAVARGAGTARLAEPVIIQRLTSIAALVFLGLLGAISLPVHELGPFVVAFIGVGAVVAFAIVVLSSAPGRRLAFIAPFILRLGLEPRGATAGGRLRSAAWDGFGLAILFHAISLLLGLVLVVAVDPEAVARPLAILGALAVARLSLAVPLSPNGIGIQEGVLVILFVQLGLPPDTAIAGALLNRLAMLMTASLGSAWLLYGVRVQTTVAARPS